MHSRIIMCVFHAESLSDVFAGEWRFLFAVLADIMSGAGDNGYILYDRVHAVLFYDLSPGLEDGVDRSGRFSVRKYHPAAVFPEKIPVFRRNDPLCLHAEHSISDIQRRSCRRGNNHMYPQTSSLAGNTAVSGNCPMETGGKKNHDTGRLTP